MNMKTFFSLKLLLFLCSCNIGVFCENGALPASSKYLTQHSIDSATEKTLVVDTESKLFESCNDDMASLICTSEDRTGRQLDDDENGAVDLSESNDVRASGRMIAYAFFVQTCREEHEKKHPDETIIFKEFSKKCAERWKAMSDEEKNRFHEMADEDKKRYDTEMQSYVLPKGEKSAFFWFCNDERDAVKVNNPDYGVEDIAKELDRKWADAEPRTKQKYEAMAEKDKARNEREMMEYKKKSKPAPIPEPVSIKKSDSEEPEDDDNEEDN